MHYGLIYLVNNLANNKKYIGKTTKTLEERRQTHIYSANSKNKMVFHKALNKYGADRFEWITIDTANNEKELNKKEVYWISYYKTFAGSKRYEPWGYNMTMGGEGSGSGENHYNYGVL